MKRSRTADGKRPGASLKEEKERELEDFLFGKDIVAAAGESLASSTGFHGNNDDSISIFFDRGPLHEKQKKKDSSAWQDEDDEIVEIDLEKSNRLKKLKNSKKANKSKVTGTEYSQLLKDRFGTGAVAWAEVPNLSAEDENIDGGDDDDDLAILRRSRPLVDGGKSATDMAKRNRRAKAGVSTSRSESLEPGKIDIKRLVDANAADPAKGAITDVKFHKSGDLLLVASEDKYLRFFKVDGENNPRQLVVQFRDMTISSVSFLEELDQVVVAGRKPYFYVYNMVSGKASKIPGIIGKGLKSHERMSVSPEGGKLAVIGNGGYVHIVCGKQKTWMMDLKMNTAARSTTFLDEYTLLSSGLDADVYTWDLRMNGRCVSRFHHDDGTCSSAMASFQPSGSSSGSYSTFYDGSGPTDGSRGFIAVGAESGVVSVFDSGVVRGGTNPATSSYASPAKVKSIMNLTMKINSLAFHPSGQILAMASDEARDQLRLAHIPTCTVFSNWPTDRTPFKRVKCLAFSPGGGGYLAVGNNKGRVLLYRMNHFNSA